MDLQSRTNDAVLILDKPYNHISHEITNYVKKLLGIKRTGHAGTLDPNVTGVLPIALGRATKLLQYMTTKRKTYIGIIKFKHLQKLEDVQQLFKRFTGEIVQTPPKQSAVRKIPRKRTVYRLELLELEDRLGLFIAEVEAGTYIRTLCKDIGRHCGDARMEELRRISVENISEKQAVNIQTLIDAVWLWKNKGDPSLLEPLLHPPEKFINFPKIVIKESAISSIFQGAQIMVPAIDSFPSNLRRNQLVKLYSSKGSFIGIGKTELNSDEFERKTHGLAVRLQRVHKSLEKAL